MQTVQLFLSRTARIGLAVLALGICASEAWIAYRHTALPNDDTPPAKSTANTAEAPAPEALHQSGPVPAAPQTDLALGLSAPVFPAPSRQSIGANLWLGSADLTVAGLSADLAADLGAGVPVAVAAIPEPSTYAAFAGVFALGLAAWRQRARA